MSEEKVKLTPKQKLFADYYVGQANLNATKAAIFAGYSKKTARSIANENLTKPDILSYVEARLDELTMTSKEVLLGLTVEAKGSIADVLETDGSFDFEAMCERGADKLVKKLKIKTITKYDPATKETSTEVIHEFEMYDSQAAKVHLGKFHKLFTDKFEGELNITETEVITPKIENDDNG